MNQLTIIMPTYNKEKYIGEALDSIFAQKTKYGFGILVADDCSADGTLSIVEQYRKLYPGKIDVLTSSSNQKLYRNVVRAYAMLQSPYFAVLDPDDYWKSPDHIENALNFLGQHPDYTIYSSEIEMIEPDGTRRIVGFADRECTTDYANFLRGNACVGFTQSAVFRNVVFARGLPEIMRLLPFASMEESFRGDTFRTFLHIREGKAYFSPKVEGCYRLTDDGIYAGLNTFEQNRLNATLWLNLYRYEEGKYPELLFRAWKCYVSGLRCFAKCGVSADPRSGRFRRNLEMLAELEDVFATCRKELDAGAKKTLSFKKRLKYPAYAYLRDKGIVI